MALRPGHGLLTVSWWTESPKRPLWWSRTPRKGPAGVALRGALRALVSAVGALAIGSDIKYAAAPPLMVAVFELLKTNGAQAAPKAAVLRPRP